MLELRLYPPATSNKVQRPQPHWPSIHRELKRPGVTLQLLWEEYRGQHPGGYAYSQFCEHYRAWKGRLTPTMRQTHIAGERLFVDYAGTTLTVIDGLTGEVMTAQLFVAVLGASSYTYAEATWTQTLADWIGSHTRAFAFFGGVTAIIVSDNIKAGITKACFYEPAVNRAYADLAKHYETAIVPARPYKPRDKAKVEVGVQVATRWVIAKLRNRTFFSLSEINSAIRELVAQLNDRVTRHLGASRRSLFEGIERHALKSLPAEPYVFARMEGVPCRDRLPRRGQALLLLGAAFHAAREDVGTLSRKGPSRCSTTAIVLPCTRGSLWMVASTARCPITCPRAIGASPTGRWSASSGKPARSVQVRRRSPP